MTKAAKITIAAMGLSVLLVAGITGGSTQASSVSLPHSVVDGDYYDVGAPAESRVALGRALFFDKILSGNRNISCATCHHPELASADGVSLGLGEGGTLLGPDRRAGATVETGVHGRIPRNSPALFNLGAREYTRFFHDGRVEVDTDGYYVGGFVTPAKWKLPVGLDNALAAQAMFPVGSPDEMAGHKGENTIADAVSLNNMAGSGGVWEQLGERLQAIPEYVKLFQAAFPERIGRASDVTYVDAANAIAAFESTAFRSDNSPFDYYLRGSRRALDPGERRGLDLFYGDAGCSTCHSGAFQTDHEFHAIAMPQIGPGKGDGYDASYWSATGEKSFLEDVGRGRVTVRAEDDFKFRTPSLRNVELTGPWGHDGAYPSLDAVVRHHLDPVASLNKYVADPSALPTLDRVLEATMRESSLSHEWLSPLRQEAFSARDDWVHTQDALRQRIADANELAPVELTDAQINDLVAFLKSLTDPNVAELKLVVPTSVPSGLAVNN